MDVNASGIVLCFRDFATSDSLVSPVWRVLVNIIIRDGEKQKKKKRRGIEGGRETGPSSAVCLWNEADDDNNNDEASCLDFQGLVFSAPWSRRSSASSVSARLLL